MKFFIVIFFLFSSPILSNAQSITKSKGQIEGYILDSSTKLPVNYATIAVFKAGSTTTINGASSDSTGKFIIKGLSKGKYTLSIDFIGYQRKRISFVQENERMNLELPIILLSSGATQLNDVTIISSKPIIENKIDKMVYNPANDLTTQGSMALDVLKKVPQVTVDIDGNVELQGNGNIRFLINGKPSTIFGASLAEALQSIPASQIKSIEVITSPGAKYDASGTGGIINIILKNNNINGINGNVNLSAGSRLEDGSFNLNMHKGHFGMNAFFNGNEQLNTKTISSNRRSSVNGQPDTTTLLLQNGNNNYKREGYESGISANWSITPRDEVTGSFNYNHFSNNNNGLTNQQETITDNFNNVLSEKTSTRNSHSQFKENASDFSLTYKKTFRKKDQELDFLYSSSSGTNGVNISQQQQYANNTYPLFGLISNNPGKDQETDIKIDYVQPFTKKFTLETGAKIVIENITNSIITDTLLNNGTYGNDADQTFGFNYNRKIYAGYISSSFSALNDFIEGKAGLRYEYTQTSSGFKDTHIPGYGIVSPSFVLSHTIDEHQSIKISYSYRLERPDYRDLNPFYNISDPHNISSGNPNLKPELGHHYELGYNRSFDKGASIYLAAFYRYNTDDIQSFTTFYPTITINGTEYSNVSLSQRYNVGREINTGANIYISIPVTNKFSMRSNMLFADRITNNPGNPTVSGFMSRINLNASYDFGHDLAAEIFGNYRSSQRTIQGHNPSSIFYNLAIRKQFLNRRASIAITATNPFNKYINQRQIVAGSNFYQTSLRQIPYQSFGISLGYRFGKLDFSKDDQNDSSAVPMPGDN